MKVELNATPRLSVTPVISPSTARCACPNALPIPRTVPINPIGFIGTVRGIGNALGQAHRAVEGDITGVTESLGVAFNSTFIALLISIVLMFLIHALQSSQERLVLDVRRYCDDWFVRRLRS